MNNQQVVIETPGLSAQLAELTAVLNVFQSVDDTLIFLRMVYMCPSLFPCWKFVIHLILICQQNIILAQESPFCIGHIQAHSGLPGPLAAGND